MEFLTSSWYTGKYIRLNQTIRNLTCGDLEISIVTGRNRIEKDLVHVPPKLDWGNGREGVRSFSVCGVPLDDWANGGSVNRFFTYAENAFSSIGNLA